jgi:hypothetical protein
MHGVVIRGSVTVHRMKTNFRTFIKTGAAAVLLTAALAGPVAAAPDKQVPFSGSMQGNEIGVEQGDSLIVNGSGAGIATLLGQFTVTWSLTVNLAGAVGSFHFTAANGDSVDTTIAGSAEPTATPGVFSITEINTITGGTGRFANAKGTFILERLTNLNTGFTSGSFHGTITSPGAAK